MDAALHEVEGGRLHGECVEQDCPLRRCVHVEQRYHIKGSKFRALDAMLIKTRTFWKSDAAHRNRQVFRAPHLHESSQGCDLRVVLQRWELISDAHGALKGNAHI